MPQRYTISNQLQRLIKQKCCFEASHTNKHDERKPCERLLVCVCVCLGLNVWLLLHQHHSWASASQHDLNKNYVKSSSMKLYTHLLIITYDCFVLTLADPLWLWDWKRGMMYFLLFIICTGLLRGKREGRWVRVVCLWLAHWCQE